MEVRDLDYFLACGKTGSFTAAVADGHAGPVPVPVDDPGCAGTCPPPSAPARRPTAATTAVLRALSPAAPAP